MKKNFRPLLTASIMAIYIILNPQNTAASGYEDMAESQMEYIKNYITAYREAAEYRQATLLHRANPNLYADPDDIQQHRVYQQAPKHRSPVNKVPSVERGAIIYSDGAKYMGYRLNGKPEWEGTMTTANGDIYVGSWHKGKPEGQGTMTWATGDKYVGSWHNGMLEGQGIGTAADGEVTAGIWHENKIVDRTPESIAARDELYKQRNITKAKSNMAEYIKKAGQGDSDAQYELGVIYEDGLGVPKDISKAIEWYKKAAALGDSSATRILSSMAATGECENAGGPEHIPGIKGTIIRDNRCK